MTLYDDSGYQVRPEVTEAHERAFDGFRRPGTWWTGAERAEIVAEVRRARIAAGVQEGDAEDAGAHADLPDGARKVIAQVAVAPKDIGRDFYNSIVPGELSDTQYVELVGQIARTVNMDIFARGIGAPLNPVGKPESGEPTRERPDGPYDDVAFAPMIHNGRRGGEIGASLYGGEMMPNILRSTSLVPDECRAVMDVAVPQYVPMKEFMNLDFTNDPAISRTQVELIAGRVSAINECFY